MILPYIATALLILVTLYSGIVSFWERPEDAASSWIFPQGVRKSARILVGFATLILAIGFVAWVRSGTQHLPPRSYRFLIPENYTGWVRIEFEVTGADQLPVEAGHTLIKSPPSGLLRTSSPEQFGWAKDEYFYYSGAGLRPLPAFGSGRMIWGKINGEASGSSGKRKYEEFFVGTEQQFKDQAIKEDKTPAP